MSMKNLKHIFRQALFAFMMFCGAHVYAANVSYPINLASGWNLLGNSLDVPLDVKTTLGAHAEVVSVWKWDATAKSWAFYSPSLDTAGTLVAYAGARGYAVLSSIAPGEGYWVNATGAFALGTQTGSGFSLSPAQLLTGWNLSATADDVAPTLFSSSMGSVTSLWAWDNATGTWYFHAPNLQANGTLASYIASKNYLDFGARTLGNGLGFWVNYAGASGGAGGSGTPACMISAGTAKICYETLPVPFTCDAKGMNNSTWILDYAGYTAQSAKAYQALSTCTGSGYNMAGTVFTTVANDAVVLTPFGTTLSLNGDYLDATGNAARFYFNNGFGTVSGIAWDGTYLWVADTSNRAIRKLDPATGAVTSLAVQITDPRGTFNPLIAPKGITSDNANLYVTDQHSIYQISKTTGVVTVLSGWTYGPVAGGMGDIRVGTLPTTSTPSGITTDGTYLYFSDLDYTSVPGSVIKMNLATKVFTAVATGGASNAFTAAGPRGLTTDGTNLYVVQGGSRTIQKIVIATGQSSVLAGNSVQSAMRDGVGEAAVFAAPTDITTDGTYLYVTDSTVVSGFDTIRKIEISTGIVTTLAGGSSAGFLDGDGNVALFNGLGGITNIGSTLYVTDNLSAVRKIVYGAAAQGIGNILTPRVPVAPTAAATTASATAINVSWSAVNTATGYHVYRATTPNQALSAMTRLTATPITATSYLNSGLALGAYYYTVVALNAVGPGPASAEVSANTNPPTAPGGLSATNVGSGSINLNWTAASGATGYDVYRATSAGQALASMTRLTSTPTAALTYSDTGLATATLYYYKVVAINGAGSATSSEVSSVSSAPTTPTGVTATATGTTTISVTWSAVTGASTYDVYRSGTAAQAIGSMTKLTATPTAGTTWPDTGLTASTPYYYKVVANNAAGSSNASSEATATTNAPAPTTQLLGGAIQGVVPSFSAVSTFATGYSVPTDVTSDGTNLYAWARNGYRLYKIVIATGVATSVAGSGSSGSADGTGAAASFNWTYGITTDGTNVYVADTWNSKIRKVVIATGVVTTLAGSASAGSTNGTGAGASFNSPYGITTDGTSLYVADTSNHLIRKIVIATGVVTTVAGTGASGSANGTGTAAAFNQPRGITTDGTSLYVTEYGGNKIRRIVIATGAVTTLAGTGTAGSTDGAVAVATFNQPSNVTCDGTNLYVTDASSKVRKVVIATGMVSTLAGSGAIASVDGTLTGASLYQPNGITTDGVSLFVAEGNTGKVRRIR
ncbi:MAG: fibronectin type III domain-containing protein [Rhodocyclaceae bacterium]|nr:fibronectin type III domain-containing protein [Rhodocyclaceae bacterium]